MSETQLFLSFGQTFGIKYQTHADIYQNGFEPNSNQ